MTGPLSTRCRALLRLARDPVYANGLVLVANAGASALFGFLFWMVAARRYAPDPLGVGAAVVSAATLAALIGKAGFDAAIIRYAPSAGRAHVRRLLLRVSLATVGLTAVVAGVVIFLASEGVTSLGPLRTPYVTAGFLALACGTAFAWMLDAYFIAEQSAVVVLLRNLAMNVLKIGVPLFLVVAAAQAVPIAYSIGLAASVVVALALLPRHLARHHADGRPPPERGEIMAYTARNFALNVSEFLPGLLLPILVLDALGGATNARFFLAWTVASVGFLASKAIAQSSFAALVREGTPHGALRKAGVLSSILLVPFVLVLLVGAGPILGLFGPGYGGDAVELLRVLAISVVPVAVSNVFLSYLKARSPGWELTLLPAASLAALLALLPVALVYGGIVGLGLAWLAVQGVVGVYAAIRLTVLLRRTFHGPATPALRHRAHQG